MGLPQDHPPRDDAVERQPEAAARARGIVEEVLDAAHLSPDDLLSPQAGALPRDDAPATAWARYIVSQVVAADHTATTEQANGQRPASPAEAATTPSPAAPSQPRSLLSTVSRPDRSARADLVVLTGSDPIALLPGPVHEPGEGAWVPPPDRLPILVRRALASIRQTPLARLWAISGTSGMPRVRWLVLGLLWAAAFAAIVPLLFAALSASVDLEINLWEGTGDPADSAPAEAEALPSG